MRDAEQPPQELGDGPDRVGQRGHQGGLSVPGAAANESKLQRPSTDVVSRPQRALDAAVSMNDLSIVVDILNIINLQA